MNIRKYSQIPLIAMFVFASFLNLKCKDEPTKPPPALPDPIVTLTAEDASCTEVWLRLSVANATNTIITLTRDTTILDTLRLTTSDSTIVDEGLLPSHTYTYTAQILNTSYSSILIQSRTMDTTSHNFSWQTYQLGDGSSGSTLFDVAIINDTLAYAVGEIYKGGSIYNAAKWDGTVWTLKNISVDFRGSTISPPLEGLFLFFATDIWFVGSLPIHGDGQSWIIYDLRSIVGLENISLSKAWGTISSSMYFVGRGGSIAHYNGSSWTKIESGTGVDIKDVWGSVNPRNGKTEINALASFGPFIPQGRELISISGTTAALLDATRLPKDMNGIWFQAGRYYYAVGSGIYRKSRTMSAGSWELQQNGVSNNYLEAIRGNGINDFICAGDYGELLHFNGNSFKSYRSQTGIYTGVFRSVAMKGNLIIAVGDRSGFALVAMGRR